MKWPHFFSLVERLVVTALVSWSLWRIISLELAGGIIFLIITYPLIYFNLKHYVKTFRVALKESKGKIGAFSESLYKQDIELRTPKPEIRKRLPWIAGFTFCLATPLLYVYLKTNNSIFWLDANLCGVFGFAFTFISIASIYCWFKYKKA